MFEGFCGFHDVGLSPYIDRFRVLKLSVLVPGFVRESVPFAVTRQFHELRYTHDRYNMSVIAVATSAVLMLTDELDGVV
jgi:hypothetical protein